MGIALEEAEKCLEQKILTVGAVLVVNGLVVGKCHKDNFHSYHTDHAETLLLRQYFKDRVVRRGNQTISIYTTMEPCMMCLGLMMHLPVDKLFYAAKDPYGGGCCILSHPHILPFRHQEKPMQVTSCLCENEAKNQLKRFLDVNEHDFYKDKNNLLVHYILS